MRLLKRVVSSRIIQHLMFWALAYFVLISLFTDTACDTVDYIYTALFIATLQMAVYAHRRFVIWRLKTKQLFLFIHLSWGVIVLFAIFNYYFFSSWVDNILPGYYFISYYSILDLILYFLVFISLTTFLKLSKDWWQQEDARRKLVELEKEKAEVELKALMAQVNPHFLFNSLNVLYSLAIKESKESPDAILKLSDVLRYVIYDANKESVKLSDEVALINNYLGLQAYRNDETAEIEFSTLIECDHKIAPLLFLPLIENSFKHGVKGDIASTYVKMHMESNSDEVCFTIKNNKGQSSEAERNTSGGVGLENISQRLHLIYPGKHRFEIKEDNDSFEVILQIDFKCIN